MKYYLTAAMLIAVLFVGGCGLKAKAQAAVDTYEPIAAQLEETIEINEAALAEMEPGTPGREEVLAFLVEARESLAKVNEVIVEAKEILADPETDDVDIALQGVAGLLGVVGLGGWGTVLLRNRRLIKVLAEGITQADAMTLAKLPPGVAQAIAEEPSSGGS